VPLGKSRAAGRMRESTRSSPTPGVRPNSLTVSAGLRYVLANPFYRQQQLFDDFGAGLYGISGDGNLFKPGTVTGSKTAADAVRGRHVCLQHDRNNLAPSVGFAWQPPSQDRASGG